MSVLGPEPTFAAENDFLFAALGVLAARTAVRHAAQAHGSETSAQTPVSEPVLYAALGLVHLVEYVATILESLADRPSALPADGAAGDAQPQRGGLLR